MRENKQKFYRVQAPRCGEPLRNFSMRKNNQKFYGVQAPRRGVPIKDFSKEPLV
jgi:hypothetical protein